MRLLGLAMESLWVAFGKVFVPCSCPGVEIWEVNGARRTVWRGVGATWGCMTQHEKCRMVSIDGWWGFCIYFEACRHRLATAAKHTIKETILEYVMGPLVRPTSSHLHRASHHNTRSNGYRYDFGVSMSLLGSGMSGAKRPGTALDPQQALYSLIQTFL